MAATKSLSNPPWSRSRQTGLLEGEWTVMWSDQLPSVSFPHHRVSKHLDLIGCAKGYNVRNSIHKSGETKQTYTSQGQALFGNRKWVPWRFKVMYMEYILILTLPVYLHKIVSFSKPPCSPVTIWSSYRWVLCYLTLEAKFCFFF